PLPPGGPRTLRAAAERATTRRAVARVEQDRRAADADGAAPAAADPGCAVQERVDLLDAGLDRDELGAALDDHPGIDPVALVHLEREASEIAEPLLANLEQSLALALELAGGRNDVPAGRARGCVLLGHVRHVRAGGRRDALRSSRGPRTPALPWCCRNP